MNKKDALGLPKKFNLKNEMLKMSKMSRKE